jgi:hypothetical protein
LLALFCGFLRQAKLPEPCRPLTDSQSRRVLLGPNNLCLFFALKQRFGPLFRSHRHILVP